MATDGKLAFTGNVPEEIRASTGSASVRVAGLTKAFGSRVVLQGVGLEVAKGHAVALIGANGAGKSTLLRSLIRLVEPDRGDIEVLGEAVTTLKPKALKAFRSRVGMVFQRHNLVGRSPVLTNVLHGAQARASGPRTWLHCLATDAMRDEAMACLDAVGLADRAMQRADSLSGGQSQRVAIARMLMQRPELILADEPDASLDPRSGEEIMNLLYNLARNKGVTLVVISHRIEHTIRYSDRIIGLADGRIVLDLPSQESDPVSLLAFFNRGAEAA
ncbi:COG3638 ABC-type phosphate/phosphonate transport system, ATPase component [Rhabdaerophilaceae bacterium]